MFTSTCGSCGAASRFDEKDVPPSGAVLRCPKCGVGMTVMPPATEIIDLPAPKITQRREELPDLLTPVGPHPRRTDLPDLLTPVGPTSRKASASELPGPPPAPAAVRKPTATDLLGPAPAAAPTPPPEIPDLLTPVGPVPVRNIPDLLAPVGPVPVRNIPDLLAPVGPVPVRNVPDLLTPVGPEPRPGLPAPVGPEPRPGLPTPVGAEPRPGLPKPVGPEPRPGLPSPVGAEPRPGLPSPVGPEPRPGLPTPIGAEPRPGLPKPVGPEPRPGLPSPVGPRPTQGVELPAPKGFFDEAPPPRPAGAAAQSLPPLELDDLDVVPAGDTAATTELASEPPTAQTSTPFAMDGLDLAPTQTSPAPLALEGEAAYGDVDLPTPHDDGLVSFSRPTGAKAAEAAVTPYGAPAAGGRDLDLAVTPKARIGTIAGQEPAREPGVAGARPAAAPGRKRSKVLVPALAVLALAGSGAYLYTQVEIEVAGFATAPAVARRAKIAAQLAEARKLMHAESPGHWYRAAETAETAAALQRDRRAPDALALAAQARVAAAIDEGLHIKDDRDASDAMISEVLKASGQSIEADKAVALRGVLDPGKAAEEATALDALEHKAPQDPDLPLYTGWAALEAGQWQKARAAFERALKQSPDRRPALYGLGRAQMALGDAAHAKETFQRVFDKHPESRHYGAWLALTELTTPARDPSGRREKELGVLCERAPERETGHPRDRSRAWTLYGDEALAAGRFEQAAERYRVARELDANNLDALVGRAVAVIEQRSQSDQGHGGPALADARRDLEQALMLSPNHVGALVGMTRVSLLEGRPDEARKTIDAAAVIDEKNPLVQFWRGRTLEDPALADLPAAEKAYQRAIELAPRDYTAYVALSQLYMNRGAVADKQGKKAEAKGWTEKAIAVLQPIADAAKTDAHMANVLGSAYLGARDAVRAEEWFRAALSVDAQYADARANLAATLQAGGRLDEAIAEYSKAHAQAPKREDIALDLALALERKRSFADAEKVYQSLLSTDGGNVPTTRSRAAAGRYFARRGRVDLARREGDNIAAAETGNPAASFLIGIGQLADGKLNDAAKSLREATALDPQAQYFEALGRVHEQQKSLGEAMAAFDQAIKLDPSYPPPYLGLGRIYLARNDWGNALSVLDRAARLEVESDEVYVGIGDANYELHQLPAAIAAYQQALARSPGRADTHFKLGKAFFNEDRGPECVAHLRRAVELAPEGTWWLPEAWRLLGYRYRANGDQSAMCHAFKRYLELAKSTDLLREEVKRSHAACP